MKKSGQGSFVFTSCMDLHTLPPRALAQEKGLHGGFAVDQTDQGCIYYGMAGCGLLRIQPDLSKQDILELPDDLKDANFHSTKIGQFDGKTHLFLPSDTDAKVVVLSLEGEVEFVLPRPEFDAYQSKENAFKPTDTALDGDRLYVADGYGSNYISAVGLADRQWAGIFGGKTESASVHGKFGTAHGLNRIPGGGALIVADRPYSRLEITSFAGGFVESHPLPEGSRPCGIDYLNRDDGWFAVIGSLDDPQPGRPAPIYIVDCRYQVVSTLRPKEELGIEPADHIHNVVWYQHDGQLYLICQSWNPGHYFVLAQTA